MGSVCCITCAVASCQVSSHRTVKDSTWYRRLRWRGSLSRRTWWLGRAVSSAGMQPRSHSAASLTPTLDARHHPGLQRTTVHRMTGHPGETNCHYLYSLLFSCVTTYFFSVLHWVTWTKIGLVHKLHGSFNWQPITKMPDIIWIIYAC